MDLKLTVFIFLAVCLFFYNNASEVKFTNLVCHSYNESLIVINECRLKAISRNKTILNFNATLLQPLHDIRASGRLFKRANGYKPWLYKAEIDFCRFMEKPFNPLAIFLFKLIRKYTNLNHTCPYVGPIIVKGYHVQYDQMRLPVPSGDYLVEVDWIGSNTRQLYTNLYVKVDERT